VRASPQLRDVQGLVPAAIGSRGNIRSRLAAAGVHRDHGVVDSGVTDLAHPQRGHFDLGTGYHGDVWLDLDALFLRPALLRPHVRWLADRLRRHQIDAVCGPMEGGAFLAQAIADRLGTAFLAAHRAPATRPGEATAYRLPSVRGGIGGWRVVIADDAVNAGTAVRACSGQLRGLGAVPVAVAALLCLGEASATVAEAMSVPFYAASTIHSQAWRADKCLLCASGTPFTDPSLHD
jgi:orotate phosphoribosyltransferase